MSDNTNKPEEIDWMRMWAYLKYVEFMTGRKMPEDFRLADLKAQYRLAQATQPQVPNESTVPPESHAQTEADDHGADGQAPDTTSDDKEADGE